MKNFKLQKPDITILTDPMPVSNWFFKEWLFIVIRFLRNYIANPKQNYNKSIFRGHPAVTRSLVMGLETLGCNYNYNPKSIKFLSKKVLVLSGVKTLSQAIELKKRGIIDKIYAGPNIVVFASDHNFILGSSEINLVITPSNWVVKVYLEDCPELKNKIIAWPAGVDNNYWKSNENIVRDKIIIYQKLNNNLNDENIQIYIDLLRNYKFDVKIIKYGKFNHQEYLNYLQEAVLLVGFTKGESQGIAWAEAWSCDVPTFIWKNSFNSYNGRAYESSTAPYLCDQNGLFFSNIDELKSLMLRFVNNPGLFNPRDWVLKNMTDEYCANKLLNYIKSIC